MGTLFTIALWGVAGYLVCYFGIVKPVRWFQKRQAADAYYRQCQALGLAQFWLTEAEKAKFVELHGEIRRLEQIMADAEREAEEGGVVKNMDGSFSARSDLGKRLRKIVDETWPRLEKTKTFYTRLSAAPHNRWFYFKKHYEDWNEGFMNWIYKTLLSGHGDMTIIKKDETSLWVSMENLNAYSRPEELPTPPDCLAQGYYYNEMQGYMNILKDGGEEKKREKSILYGGEYDADY